MKNKSEIRYYKVEYGGDTYEENINVIISFNNVFWFNRL